VPQCDRTRKQLLPDHYGGGDGCDIADTDKHSRIMAKEGIEYLKKVGVTNEVVFQGKGKRIWLSDILDEYASQQVKTKKQNAQ
jgi:hypothetical protein